MSKPILFSLEHCVKCQQTKQLLTDRNDVEMVTFPHDPTEWTTDQLKLAQDYAVFEDLHKTAPVLWVDGEKKLGYLRIRKWIQDTATDG